MKSSDFLFTFQDFPRGLTITLNAKAALMSGYTSERLYCEEEFIGGSQ